MPRHFSSPNLDARMLLCASRDADRLTLRSLVPFPEGGEVRPFEPVHPDFVMRDVLAHLAVPMIPESYPLDSARCFDGAHLRQDLEGRRYVERSAVTFDISTIGGQMEARTVWSVSMTRDRDFLAPINRTAETLAGRIGTRAFLASRDRIQVASICAPFDVDTLDACTVLLALNPEHGIVANFDAGPSALDIPDFKVMPQLSVQGPAECGPGETVELSLALLDGPTGAFVQGPVKLIAEDTAGYLPHRRVTIEAGEARLRWTALGLHPGEEARIKIGWRLWPSAAEHTIRVR